MTFDNERIVVTDINLARTTSQIVFGQAFAFVPASWFDTPELAWMKGILGHKTASKGKILSLLGSEPRQLPGLTVEPVALSGLSLASITADKDLYKTEEDEINLLVTNLTMASSSAELSLYLNEIPFSQHAVELSADGVGLLKLSDLPTGEYCVRFDSEEDSEHTCRFTVAEYRLVPLVASITSREKAPDGKLALAIKVESFGQPATGEIIIQVLDGGLPGQSLTAMAREGQLEVTVELVGDGPHSLSLQMRSDPSKTATVPLTGTRKSERSLTRFSPLGTEVMGTLLPSAEAREVRGIYLEEGAALSSPISLEQVDSRGAKLLVKAERIEMLKLVIIDPLFPSPGSNAVDPGTAPHPANVNDDYRKAEELFKKKDYKKSLSAFIRAKAGASEKHPFYSYSIACCHAKLNNQKGALAALRLSIEEGWTDFDHMEADEDLSSLRHSHEFQSLRTGGLVEIDYENLDGGRIIEIDSPRPLTLLSMGAYIDGKPWEGWATVVAPEQLSCRIDIAERQMPGKKVTLKTTVSGDPQPELVYMIVKDARLLSSDTPRSRLASRLKDFVEDSQGKLTCGWANHKIDPEARWRSTIDSQVSAGGWGTAYGAMPPPGASGGWAGDTLSGEPPRIEGIGRFSGSDDTWGSAPPPAGGPPVPRAPMPAQEQSPLFCLDTGSAGDVMIDQASYSMAPTSPPSAAQPSPAATPGRDSDNRSAEPSSQESQPQVLFAGFVPVRKGVATLSLRLPDQFCDYIVESFASVGLEWAYEDARFRAEKDPYIDLTLPVFAREEEHTEGTVYVGAAAGSVSVSVKRDGKEISLTRKADGETNKQVTVSGEHAAFTFASPPGSYEVELRANKKIVERRSATVSEPGKLKHRVHSLRILEAGETIALSDADSYRSLRIVPGLTESFDLLLDATISYEHCCCEQTSARLLSACSMYLFSGDDEDRRNKAEAFIVAGVRRMQSMWVKGQGFRAYPEDYHGVNDYYGKMAAQNLSRALFLDSGKGSSNSSLRQQMDSMRQMAEDTMRAYRLAWPPAEVKSCEDAYATIRFGNGNGDQKKALDYVRKRTADGVSGFRSTLPANPYLGNRVQERVESAYAAACLLHYGNSSESRNAIDLANLVVSQFNEDGRLYSTVDSVAAIALMAELEARKITGGGAVEIEGRKMTVSEAVNLKSIVQSLAVTDGVCAVECVSEITEDWSQYSSGVQMRVSLLKDGKPTRSLRPADQAELRIELAEDYKEGDLVWVCLPDCLSRVLGGGQVKLFSIDFRGKTAVEIPLAATGITVNERSSTQKYAVCLRNMYDEDRTGSPGLLEIKVSE